MTGRQEEEGRATADWESLILAFLHDPVDKALDIRGHEGRAARYASAALDRTIERADIHDDAALADQRAAIAERLPMPTAGRNGERAVSPGPGGRIETRHPVGASPLVLEGMAIDEKAVRRTIAAVVDGLSDPKQLFLALWRLLPERLTDSVHPGLARLPADTRVPDHTIWHHADIATGLQASLSGVHGSAYLSVTIGPVQPFIAAARSVRDLWSGSAILSWLAFEAMRPVLEDLGPTALVFPALRGAPLVDLWLRADAGLGDRIPEPSVSARMAPSLPNRFLALVPWGEDGNAAHDLAGQCTDSARTAWKAIGDAVRGDLDGRLSPLDSGWARRWDDQIESFFDIRAAVLPERECGDDEMARLVGFRHFSEAWPDAGDIRALAAAIPEDHRPGYDQRSAGRWQAQVEMSARLMEAARTVRHVPEIGGAAEHAGWWPPKCSLFGSYEQVGPDALDASGDFWAAAYDKARIEGVRLRRGERFCAVALAKRFSVPACLAPRLGLGRGETRFPDTATVAAAEWLEAAGIDPHEARRENPDAGWSGQWLHWSRPDQEDDEPRVPDPVWKRITEARKSELGPAPAYFAVLHLDADHMGRWLRGEEAPRLGEVLHPKMAGYLGGVGDERADRALEARRPVGPALHAAISEALSNFAVRMVPGIVNGFKGTLIYAGGDDVLALLPTRSAVSAAVALKRAFRGELEGNGGAPPGWYRAGGRDLLTMGERATLSGGLAVAHFKEDLRLALEAARVAERAAKTAGRDALQITAMRRSGEHATALCPWDMADWFSSLTRAFVDGASDRWAYRLREELPTLGGPGIPVAAASAEIRRLVDRAEDDTRRRLSDGDPGSAGASLAGAWERYQRILDQRPGGTGSQGEKLADFVTLCQSASFLARGRDA